MALSMVLMVIIIFSEKEYMLAINSVELPILSHETCRMWYSAKYYTLTDSMICAGYEEGGMDACQVRSISIHIKCINKYA